MTVRSILTPPLAAVLLAQAPVAASAATRIPAPAHLTEGVEGESTWLWVGLGLVALVAIILIADSNHHHHPASP